MKINGLTLAQASTTQVRVGDTLSVRMRKDQSWNGRLFSKGVVVRADSERFVVREADRLWSVLQEHLQLGRALPEAWIFQLSQAGRIERL